MFTKLHDRRIPNVGVGVRVGPVGFQLYGRQHVNIQHTLSLMIDSHLRTCSTFNLFNDIIFYNCQVLQQTGQYTRRTCYPLISVKYHNCFNSKHNVCSIFITLLRSTVMSMSVFLSVCLSAHITRKSRGRTSPKFFCKLPGGRGSVLL